MEILIQFDVLPAPGMVETIETRGGDQRGSESAIDYVRRICTSYLWGREVSVETLLDCHTLTDGQTIPLSVPLATSPRRFFPVEFIVPDWGI